MKITQSLLATTLLSSSLLILTACNDKTSSDTDMTMSTSSPVIKKEDIVAKVNGVAITKEELINTINQRAKEGSNTASGVVLQEMINLEILRQEGVKQGIADDASVRAEIKRLSTAVIANKLIKTQFKDLVITDEQMKTEYDNQIAKLPQSEYKASHILLTNEADALEVIIDLNNGADFATLAKEKSTGPSGKNGGDLGWFQAHSMVPEFASAVKTMKKGEISKDPVKTQFGYHVIMLEDTRVLPSPTFENVKDKIKTIIVNRMLKDYLAKVTKDADIELMGEKTEAKTNESKT